MQDDVLMVVIASILTGCFSSVGTVIALKVHISYIRERLERHEKTIDRAHVRIDSIEKIVSCGLK